MKICLDAGHGYKNKDKTASGTSGNGLVEDAVVLSLCNKIAWYLQEAGHQVVKTRPSKSFVTLASRGKLAKQQDCDAFVSIHCNSVEDADAHGAEVMIAAPDSRSKPFAQKVLDVLVTAGMHSRGVKLDNQGAHSKLAVLRDTYKAMPAALVEIGFLSNPGDATRIKSGQWIESVAAGLAKAIVSK